MTSDIHQLKLETYFYWTHNFNRNCHLISYIKIAIVRILNLRRMTCRMLQIFFILLHVFGRCRETMTSLIMFSPHPWTLLALLLLTVYLIPTIRCFSVSTPHQSTTLFLKTVYKLQSNPLTAYWSSHRWSSTKVSNQDKPYKPFQ